MGGTCDVREEPGKQKPRRCRAQELARSSAQENERQKKSGLLDSARFGVRSRTTSATTAGKTSKVRDAFGMRRQTRRVRFSQRMARVSAPIICAGEPVHQGLAEWSVV
jgi:hypothetical protein